MLRARPIRRFTRGFTLLELLIVVAIIGVLATLILGALAGARKRTMIAVARANLNSLKAALQQYSTDTGRYPCSKGHPTATGDALFNNDICVAYGALRNRRTLQFGGGPNSPYVEWKPEQLGVIKNMGNFIKTTTWGVNGDANNSSPVLQFLNTGDGEALSSDLYENVNDVSFQTTYIPDATNLTKSPQVCFIDPWGNPYVYIEWASVPQSVKDAATATVSCNLGGGTGSTETHTLKPHDPSTFDMYSFGPGGINMAGDSASDNVSTWANTKK